MRTEKLNDMLAKSKRLKAELRAFYEEVEELEDRWDSVYECNADDLYARHQLYRAAGMIREAYYELDALTSPVTSEGVLKRNSNGRFSLDGYELSSGYGIEYLALDSDDNEVWMRGRIEYYDGDYRIWKRPDIALEGLRARVKA